MFAPYCPTCTSRRLLGVRRLVAGNWEGSGALYVRCHCGTILAADNPPPATARSAASADLRPTG